VAGNNTNSGSYSSILGGSGNNIPSGCTHVGVFGQNIINVNNSAFHMNNLVVQICSFPVVHVCLLPENRHIILCTFGTRCLWCIY
jgi:hypothetical protein